MIEDKEYKQIKRRSRIYAMCGVGCNVLGHYADKRGNGALSDVAATVGATASVVSVINFIRSVMKYEADDTERLLVDNLVHMVVIPTIDVLSFGYSVAPKEKKKEMIDKLRGNNRGW